ncbi:hypothetical protein CLOM_g22203 [Closterium sp. NIES-68]|nr:hypothetical protein CLOM_g22203 [Closterium sp. NIES-68]GJP80265.1 hypothetical protein CLOP_g10496 [Closterium sp. NIES-67]
MAASLSRPRASPALLHLGIAACLLLPSLVHAAETCGWNSDSAESKEWQGEFFSAIPKVVYEGPASRNIFAFRYYNADEVILGRPMKEWLRFAVAFWHTFRGDGSDPFGSPTKHWPWEDGTNSLAMAKRRMRAAFEFMSKLGAQFWCFHDRDIAPEGATLAETNANLDAVVALAAELQAQTGIRPLWGTAQLFKHPRYRHGAATSPVASVFAYAAAQVKKAMEVTHRLGGENYVFWGGREGYSSLVNTDMGLELEHLARFLSMAAEWREKLGFKGALLMEPKPQEPTKHQYDWDAATTLGFLVRYNLTRPDAATGALQPFKLNLECNHATLAGHSCEHELETARIAGALGGVDANTGDAQTGWDTDEFLTDPAAATRVMLSVVRNGGLAPGGINFDAKLRRESTDVDDLFIAHIAGMDALARGLRNVAAIIDDGDLDKLVQGRYASWKEGIGARIEKGEVGFEELETAVMADGGKEPEVGSGKQELAEALFHRFV